MVPTEVHVEVRKKRAFVDVNFFVVFLCIFLFRARFFFVFEDLPAHLRAPKQSFRGYGRQVQAFSQAHVKFAAWAPGAVFKVR